MKIRRGIPVVDGIVIAEAFVLEAENYRLPTQRFTKGGGAEDPGWGERELARFERAVEAAKAELAELQASIADEVTAKVANIFVFQRGLYEDETEFLKPVRAMIGRAVATEHAVTRRVSSIRKMWAGVPFLATKVADLDDFEQRLLRHLLGQRRETIKDLKTPVVVIARDLTPQQTAELPKSVLGFAIDHGGKTSHTAILAQSLDIPAVVGLGQITGDVVGGELVILDGRGGKVIVDPDDATLALYQRRKQEFEEDKRGLHELRTLPAETLDGHRIHLFANIGSPDEIARALEFGAEGIGLYRTEFLYDDDHPDPSEEDHYDAYSRGIDSLGGRPLVIRTLDLGADKFRPAGLEHEQNPFLGCRSIRYCLMEQEDVFRRQLRAILRVSAQRDADVRLMLPMISSLEEFNLAKEMIEDVKADLRADGEAFRVDLPVGIMIEVPSAALLADVLAQHADFFSIGTNDLVQYVLAVDRTNEKVQNLYQPAHPAVFRLVLGVVKAARRHKIPVSICGELSGDPRFTLPLLGLGMRDLSMAPALIPRIKRFVRATSAQEAGRTVDRVLQLEDARGTLEFLDHQAREIDPAFFV